MRLARKVFTIVASMAILGAFPGAALADDDPAEEAAAAAAANAGDIQDSETAYAGYLASNPSVTCDTRGRQAYGAAQVEHEDVGAVFARDEANWSVECVSLAEEPPEYDLVMTITFQSWDGDSWENIEETTKTYTTPSNAGQAARTDAVNLHVYDYDHDSLNTWHRAEYRLISPEDLVFYSAQWYSGPRCRVGAGVAC